MSPLSVSSTSPLDVTQSCEAKWPGGGGCLRGCKFDSSSRLAGVLSASFSEHILKCCLESAKHRDFPLGFQLFLKFRQLLGL